VKMQTRLVHQVTGARSSRARSRVTNGRTLFVEGDGRGPWARRWRDLCEAHIADLGGAASLSEAQRSLIRRCATIEVELERIEGRLSGGESCDLSAYATAAGHLRRILETLGIERKPRDVTPPFQQYLAQKVLQTDVIEPEDGE
jgi:hypothetical protein